VCLSLWKVDDKATALLMQRFYANLLGLRPGLSHPLPKARALQEAKEWLRELTLEEVSPALAALQRGAVRPLATSPGGGSGPGPRPGSSPRQPSSVRPYAHPYYWAAFVLVGDPD